MLNFLLRLRIPTLWWDGLDGSSFAWGRNNHVGRFENITGNNREDLLLRTRSEHHRTTRKAGVVDPIKNPNLFVAHLAQVKSRYGAVLYIWHPELSLTKPRTPSAPIRKTKKHT